MRPSKSLVVLALLPAVLQAQDTPVDLLATWLASASVQTAVDPGAGPPDTSVSALPPVRFGHRVGSVALLVDVADGEDDDDAARLACDSVAAVLKGAGHPELLPAARLACVAGTAAVIRGFRHPPYTVCAPAPHLEGVAEFYEVAVPLYERAVLGKGFAFGGQHAGQCPGVVGFLRSTLAAHKALLSTVCVVGLNAGYLSLAALWGTDPAVRVFAFSTGHRGSSVPQHSAVAASVLAAWFGDRFGHVGGALPTAAAMFALQAKATCDVVLLDGAVGVEDTLAELALMRLLVDTKRFHVVALRDAAAVPSRQLAWSSAVAQGIVSHTHTVRAPCECSAVSEADLAVGFLR